LSDSNRTTIVLLGAGVQENAWSPVVRAIARTSHPRVASPDQANAALANLVYKRRFWRKRFLQEDANGGATTLARSADAKYATEYDDVRRAFCEELRIGEESGELRIRPSFSAVWNALVAQTHHFYLVTTNWDRLLSIYLGNGFAEISDDAIFHLHGDRRDPSRLLLPTENVDEPYRDPALVDELAHRKQSIMRIMEQADVVVIIGLSLSQADGDLAQVVAVGLDLGSVREIYVADPEHVTVCGRLTALLRHRSPWIVGCHPDSPSERVSYAQGSAG